MRDKTLLEVKKIFKNFPNNTPNKMAEIILEVTNMLRENGFIVNECCDKLHYRLEITIKENE